MKYQVILADPPWDYYGSTDNMGDAAKHYLLMKNEDIFAMPIRDTFLDNPGVMFLWATCPKLDVAIDTLKKWGLHYRGVAFVWVKTTLQGIPIKATGVRPSFVKPLVELVLIGSTDKKGRTLPLSSESVVQTIFAPRAEHSRKPKEVFEKISLMYPNVKKLEMFARGKAHDSTWSVWGNEAK
jgi:N6-adenosine-specific RNA methylase IME4